MAEMAALNPFDFFVEPDGRDYPFAYEPALKKDLAPYLECERPGPLCGLGWPPCRGHAAGIVDFLVG